MQDDWKPAETATEDVVVETKIDDGGGVRNIAELKRSGNLWWMPDGSMYVYYRPTHWRHIQFDLEEAIAEQGAAA